MVGLVMHRFFLLGLWIASEGIALAEEDESIAAPKIEISFGSSLLFIEQPLISQGFCLDNQRTVPIPSVLLLGEYFLRERLTLGVMLNIPTSPRRLLVDDELIEEHAAVTAALGLTHRPVQHLIWEDQAILVFQYGVLGGRSIRSSRGDQYFPLVFVRPSIGTPGGFSMYLGTAYAFRNDTLALLYGVGQQF
jgi:hypothetical protein